MLQDWLLNTQLYFALKPDFTRQIKTNHIKYQRNDVSFYLLVHKTAKSVIITRKAKENLLHNTKRVHRIGTFLWIGKSYGKRFNLITWSKVNGLITLPVQLLYENIWSDFAYPLKEPLSFFVCVLYVILSKKTTKNLCPYCSHFKTKKAVSFESEWQEEASVTFTTENKNVFAWRNKSIITGLEMKRM